MQEGNIIDIQTIGRDDTKYYLTGKIISFEGHMINIELMEEVNMAKAGFQEVPENETELDFQSILIQRFLEYRISGCEVLDAKEYAKADLQAIKALLEDTSCF